MARAEMVVTLKMRDVQPVRLLIWEIEELRSRMVTGASPFASELDAILTRFAATNDSTDDDPEEPGDV